MPLPLWPLFATLVALAQDAVAYEVALDDHHYGGGIGDDQVTLTDWLSDAVGVALDVRRNVFGTWHADVGHRIWPGTIEGHDAAVLHRLGRA